MSGDSNDRKPTFTVKGFTQAVRNFLWGRDRRQVAIGAAASAAAARPVATGRITLVGLNEIKVALGPRWPKLADAVHALAASVIARHVRRGDLFERLSDDSYVVMFAELERAEADAKAALIGTEIATRLLASTVTELARVETVRADVPVEALRGPDVLGALEAGFASGRGATVCRESLAARPSPALLGGPPSFDGPEMARLSAVLQTAVQGPDAGTTGPPPGTDRAQPARLSAWSGQSPAGPDPERLRPCPPEPASPVALAGHVPDDWDRPPAAPAAEPPRWRFCPIWDFRKKALIEFRLIATIGRRLAHPYLEDASDGCEAILFQNDLQALSVAVHELQRLACASRRLPIIVPVHFSSTTLESRRSRLVNELSRVPEAGRRFLTVEIYRPRADSARALAELKAGLQPLGVRCTACFDAEDLAEVAAAAPHILRAATTCPPLRSERDVAYRLSRFSARAAACGLEVLAYDLRSRALAVNAAAAGFRFLSGAAISPMQDKPGRALRFETSDLYAAVS
jgi:hypothetical protein